MKDYRISISIFLVLFLLVSQVGYSKPVTEEITYQTCFTPGQECTSVITDILDSAKNSIYVQAFSFTSGPIARALVRAKRRGLEVIIILDKSQFDKYHFSLSHYFLDKQVPVYIDYKPQVAHNKVMIIDKETIITGSFNFTKAAQYKNAENLLILTSKPLAEKYYQNWQSRFKQSISAEEFFKEFNKIMNRINPEG